MGRSIARGSKQALVDQCFGDPEVHNYILKMTGQILRRELKAMCSAEVQSVLSSMSKTDLETFTWDKLENELTLHAPTLRSILYACMVTRRPRANRAAAVGICAAVLLKYRYQRMSLVQKVIALILYAGHCGKQVHVCCGNN